MSRGLLKHQARQEALQGLGRALARRAKSSCELCGASGVPLRAFEVPPSGEEPTLEATLLLCERCQQGAQGGPLEPEQWRFLENAVWLELAAAQVCAVRLTRRLAGARAPWASALLEDLYLSPEVEAWAGQG
jgi:protein PhnA